MKYDPQIGIHGMDVSVEMGRTGFRVLQRRVQSRPLPKELRSTRDETRAFLTQALHVTLLE